MGNSSEGELIANVNKSRREGEEGSGRGCGVVVEEGVVNLEHGRHPLGGAVRPSVRLSVGRTECDAAASTMAGRWIWRWGGVREVRWKEKG